jgi:RNA polymerase sigma-70 factor (ECF subfamily)
MLVLARVGGVRSATMEKIDLVKFQAGDGRVFAELMASLDRTLRHQIAKFVTDRDEADDLYSELWEKIFERRREFRAEGPFAAWATILCRRICVDHARSAARARRRVRLFVTPVGTATETRSDRERIRDATHQDARLESVTNAVVALPPRMRAIAISHWYFGHSAASIAREFGLTAPTVWTTLSKIRTLLRARLLQVVRTPSRTPP